MEYECRVTLGRFRESAIADSAREAELDELNREVGILHSVVNRK